MRANTIDIAGERFRHLTVIRYVGPSPDSAGAAWLCRCDCGNERTAAGSDLRRGRVNSCGIGNHDRAKRKSPRVNLSREHSEHRAWRGARNRCFNPKDPDFRTYGGAGITMCDRWRRSFLDFLADVGPRPSPKHTLDRYPNNAGNYEPGNVRWATAAEQNRNRRDNRMIEHNGRIQCVTDWARELGMSFSTIFRRLNAGWSNERALTSGATR